MFSNSVNVSNREWKNRKERNRTRIRNCIRTFRSAMIMINTMVNANVAPQLRRTPTNLRPVLKCQTIRSTNWRRTNSTTWRCNAISIRVAKLNWPNLFNKTKTKWNLMTSRRIVRRCPKNRIWAILVFTMWRPMMNSPTTMRYQTFNERTIIDDSMVEQAWIRRRPIYFHRCRRPHHPFSGNEDEEIYQIIISINRLTDSRLDYIDR